MVLKASIWVKWETTSRPILLCVSRRKIRGEICNNTAGTNVHTPMHAFIYLTYLHHTKIILCTCSSHKSVGPTDVGATFLWEAHSMRYPIRCIHTRMSKPKLLSTWPLFPSILSMCLNSPPPPRDPLKPTHTSTLKPLSTWPTFFFPLQNLKHMPFVFTFHHWRFH